MPVMAKKRVSGKHKAERKPVMLPAEWQRVLRGLAAERPMPAVWLLVELIKREAESKGVADLPAVPWQAPADEKPD